MQGKRDLFFTLVISRAADVGRCELRMKILPLLLLLLLVASCASYHDGNKKGIFLKNNASGTVVYAGGKIDLDNNRVQPSISFTRPTSPLSKRTLIPCGCTAEFVRIFFTTPSVSFPVRWSCFNTIETRKPGLMSARLVPFMRYSPVVFGPSFS
jgi:hypothetical protein